MTGWESVPLSDAIVKRSGTVDPAKHPDEMFDLYSIPAYDRGSPDHVLGAQIGSSKQIVQAGDVLLSRIVPHIRRAWIVGVDKGRRLIASGEWIVFRSGKFDPGWLRHMLLSDQFHREFMATVAGVGGSLLRARPAQVALIGVSVPPLDEQRRIAAILDQAAYEREMAARRRGSVDSLRNAIFQEMFGACEPTELLDDYCKVQGGVQVSAKRKSLPVELPYLRVANVYRGRLDLREVKTIRVTEAEAARTRVEPGDLLFVEGHANPNEVGRSAVWTGSIPNCLHQNHLIRVRLDAEKLLPVFAVAWFNSPAGSAHFRRAGKTTSGLNTINASQLRSAPIPLPPIREQLVFASRCRDIDQLGATCDEAAILASELFASLQSRAFRGDLSRDSADLAAATSGIS